MGQYHFKFTKILTAIVKTVYPKEYSKDCVQFLHDISVHIPMCLGEAPKHYLPV